MRYAFLPKWLGDGGLGEAEININTLPPVH
jgi:hypothetical protein